MPLPWEKEPVDLQDTELARNIGLERMNLELLDPFAKTVPDNVDSLLSYGVEDATICTFDKRGTYLAVGYATGIVVIWDFITRGIGRVIEAHGRGITALSWAKGSRRLLTASHDHRLHLWALDTPRPELIRVHCLDSPVLSAMMYPGVVTRALALTASGIVYLVDFQRSSRVPLVPGMDTSPPQVLPPPPSASRPSPSKRARTGADASSTPAVLCMAIDRRGPHVVFGTADGQITTIKASGSKLKHSFSVQGCSKVKQLDFSRDGKWVLVNSGERIIQMLERESTSGKSVRDFHDAIDHSRWQCCRFTGDSEYVAGGSRADSICSISIWSVGGGLVTKIEGPQMSLLSLARHPVRPFLAAALTNGKVQLWGATHIAHWTAFAADFEELDENVEYKEREDEFDIVVDSWDPERRKGRAEAEPDEEDKVPVTIDAMDNVRVWSSDSDEDEGTFYLTTEPGAAAREGWYDLEVQTSKRGSSHQHQHAAAQAKHDKSRVWGTWSAGRAARPPVPPGSSSPKESRISGGSKPSAKRSGPSGASGSSGSGGKPPMPKSGGAARSGGMGQSRASVGKPEGSRDGSSGIEGGRGRDE